MPGPAWANGRSASSGSATASAVCSARRAAGRSPEATASDVSSNHASTRVCGSKGRYGSVEHRAEKRPRVLVAASGRLGPRPHHQQLGVVAGAVGQPAQDRPRRRGVPEQQRGAELQHRHRGELLRTRRAVAELRARLLQLGQPVRPVPQVEGGGAVDGLQGEPQPGGRCRDPQRQALGREAFGFGGLRAHELGVGQHRRGGGGPRRVLPAVLARGREGLAAHRAHRLHVARAARDDTQQREALHRQVVEAVAPAQVQRGFELRACPGPVVPLETSGAPAQPGERLQLGFGGQLADVPDGERGATTLPTRPRRRRTARRRRAAPPGPRGRARARTAVRGADPRGRRGAPRPRGGSAPRSGRAMDWSRRPARRRWPARAAAARGPRRGSAERRSGAAGRSTSAASWLCAACSRAWTGSSLPAHQRAAHAVQLGHPLHPLAVEVGEQVRPQELLDAVGVAPRPGG